MRLAAIIVLLVLAMGAVWVAGETRYENCLERANAVQLDPWILMGDEPTSVEEALNGPGPESGAEMRARVSASCTKLPF